MKFHVNGNNSWSKEYQTKYPNIVLIRRSNGGLPEARNTGLENANGKYVTFVDPDDYVETNVYGKLINKIQKFRRFLISFIHSPQKFIS